MLTCDVKEITQREHQHQNVKEFKIIHICVMKFGTFQSHLVPNNRHRDTRFCSYRQVAVSENAILNLTIHFRFSIFTLKPH